MGKRSAFSFPLLVLVSTPPGVFQRSGFSLVGPARLARYCQYVCVGVGRGATIIYITFFKIKKKKLADGRIFLLNSAFSYVRNIKYIYIIFL